MERFVDSGQARLWTTQMGKGPPLLLLNGSACSDYLAPVSHMLEHRHTVIRFEPRGAGRSSWDGHYDLATLLADIEAIRRSYGVESWTLVGHSAGVNHALVYATRHPEVIAGVVGMAGGVFVSDRDWHRAYDAGLDAGGDETGDLAFDSDPELLAESNREWKAFIKTPGVLRQLADLAIPCVLLGAERDIRPTWPLRQLAELIPRGRYAEIQGGGHFPWLTHAAGVDAALNEALDYVGSVPD